MKQFERRREGVRYIVEACGVDRGPLDERRAQIPGSYVQWEAGGIPVAASGRASRMSGPIYVLWRPVGNEQPEPAPKAPPIRRPIASVSARTEPVAVAPVVVEPAYPELEDPADFLFDPPVKPADKAPASPPGGRSVSLAASIEAMLTATPRPEVPSRRQKSVMHKNLTRVDRPERNMHGYHVRLAWKGVYYQKWLSDAAHGGRMGALEAAIAWRDAKERELGKPRTEHILKGHDRTSNTGIVGVALVTVRGRRYYRALWLDAERKMHRRWFSIDELGESQALQAAVKAREQGLSERLGAGAAR